MYRVNYSLHLCFIPFSHSSDDKQITQIMKLKELPNSLPKHDIIHIGIGRLNGCHFRQSRQPLDH